jgi:hypothetical protein
MRILILLITLLFAAASCEQEALLPCKEKVEYLNEMVLINWWQCHVEYTEERADRYIAVREELCECYPDFCANPPKEFIIN